MRSPKSWRRRMDPSWLIRVCNLHGLQEDQCKSVCQPIRDESHLGRFKLHTFHLSNSSRFDHPSNHDWIRCHQSCEDSQQQGWRSLGNFVPRGGDSSSGFFFWRNLVRILPQIIQRSCSSLGASPRRGCGSMVWASPKGFFLY